MSQGINKVKQNHHQFIKRVCETGIVWALKNRDGLATSSSTKYINKNGEDLGLICFWSDKNLATACAIDDWDDYKPSEILLSEFIEHWCLGMSNDGFIVGCNFDQNMFGEELDPLDLILDLNKELLNQKKEIKLKKFDHINSLVEQIEKLD